MSRRPILRFPDPRLALPAAAVAQFDDALAALAADLLDTMWAAPGIGITAPHIGVLQRLTVIELDAQSGVKTYVNPEIIWSSTETISHAEGSVSMPGISEDVTRPNSVRVRYQTLTGEVKEEAASGLLSHLPPARDRSTRRHFLASEIVAAEARAGRSNALQSRRKHKDKLGENNNLSGLKTQKKPARSGFLVWPESQMVRSRRLELPRVAPQRPQRWRVYQFRHDRIVVDAELLRRGCM